MKTRALVFLTTTLIALAGCKQKPPTMTGLYEAHIGDPPEHMSLDFRPDHKVMIRRLSDNNPFVVESDYTLKGDHLTIKQFGFEKMTGYLELNLEGDTLIAANGKGFVKVAPGKTFSPVERANAEVEAQEKLAAARLLEQKNKAAQIDLEKTKISAKEAEFKLRAAELQKEVEASNQKNKADETQAAAARAEALEKRKIARATAIAHLPQFTNQTVTLHGIDGSTYSDVSLVRASASGITYSTLAKGAPGFVWYTNLVIDDMARVGVDTNILPSAEELADAKLKDDLYRKQQAVLASTAAEDAHNAYVATLLAKSRQGDRASQQALKGMGLNPYTGTPMPDPSTAAARFRSRYGQ
jgi:hypothetical protein